MTKRKNKKLFVATLLAVPAAVVVADDMKVSANTGVQEGTVSVPGNFPQVQTRSMSTFSSGPTLTATSPSDKTWWTLLEAEMENYNPNVTIKYTPTPSSTITEAEIHDLVNDAITGIFSDLFTNDKDQTLEGMFNGYQYTYRYEGNTATIQLKLNYLTSFDNNTAANQKIYTEFNSLSTKSALEKVKAIHDYIIKNSTYTTSNDGNSPYDVYTLSEYKKGAAQAYSMLAYKAARSLGVEVQHVVGTLNGTSHSWNQVKIGGKWYLWDVLSDDFLSSATSTNKGNISYKHFLKGNSTINGYKWDTTVSHTLETLYNDNTYNDAFQEYKDFVQVGSVVYYTHNIDDGKKNNLMKHILTGAGGTLLSQSIKGSSVVEGDFLHEFGSSLYFRHLGQGNKIYKMSLDGSTGDFIVFEPVISFKIEEGILTYVTNANVTKTITLNGTVDVSVKVVKDRIAALSETSTVLEIIQTRLAYNALTSTQRIGVDITNLTDAESGKNFTSGPYAVMIKIEQLSIHTLDYQDKIAEIETALSPLSLTAAEKALITNIDRFNDIKGQINTDESIVRAWQTKVGSLNTNLAYEGVKEARAQYEAMTLAQKARDTGSGNLNNVLKGLEVTVANEKAQILEVSYAISKLNEESKTFIEDTAEAKRKYDALPMERQRLDIGNKAITDAVKIAAAHTDTAIKFLGKVNAWSNPTIAQIEEAKIEYYNFVPAIRGYLDDTNGDYTPEGEPPIKRSKILEELKLNTHTLAGMDDATLAVAKQIEAIDLSTLNIGQYNQIKKADDNFGLTKEQIATIPSTVITKWNVVVAAVGSAQTAADNVKSLIDALDKSSDETTITAALDAYDKLIAIAKELIPEKTKIAEYVLIKNILVVERLIKEAVASKSEAGVKKAREAYEKLPQLSKGEVGNLSDLVSLEAKLVFDKIMGISKPIQTDKVEIDKVRAELKELTPNALEMLEDIVLDPTVTDVDIKEGYNAIDILEKVEALYVEEEIKTLTIASNPARVEEVRKLLDALTPGAKAKVDSALITELKDLDDKLVDVTEKADAKLVNEAIVAAYTNIATITREEYNALLAKYNALNTKAKTYVTTENEAKLDELKTAVEAKEIDLEKAKKEADPVIKLINALTSRSSAEELKKARDAYTALSPAAQKVVQDDKGALLKKLEDFEKALTEKEKEAADKAAEEKARAEAREVEIKINAISETSTLEEVKVADAAYTALSDTAKTFISASAKTKLESLLAAKEKEYKETHGKAQTEAKDVSDRIDKITTATTVKELQSIRRAYEALSELAKTYVTNIAKLTSSEVYQEQQAKIVAAAKNEAAAFDTYMADLTRNSTTAEIAKARAFYNNLSAEAKKHSKTLEKLIKLETMWSDPDYIDLYLNYYPHYTDQQPTGGIEITAPKPDPLFIPDTVATTNAGPGEIAMDYRDGNYTATVFATDAPGSTKSKLTLTSSNNVKVSIPKKDILALKKLPVTVSTAVGYKSVTISFTEGYTAKTFSDFVEIKVPISELGANSKSVILCKLPNGQYEKASYQVLDGAFVIKTKVGATFVVEDKSTTAPTTTASTGYKDINSSANSTYINELAKLGIVSGGTASNYYPSQNITRGDFAIMIARAANLTTSTTTSLTDVRNTANASLIEALNESGIMRGTTPTRFSMSGTITREEASVILARLFRHLKMDVATMQNEQQTNYRDIANLSYESRRSIALMDLLEIFDSSATAFKPTAKLTRGEFAKVLSKAMEAAELK